MKHLVPILDHGVTIDRGDHVIVLLDGAGMPDMPAPTLAGLADAVERLLDRLDVPRRDERQRTEQER